MRHFTLALSVLALSACAPLTAHSPLFSTADQQGPAPLAEGLWVQETDHCRPEAHAQTAPDGCAQSHVSRLPDGSWRFTMEQQKIPGGSGGEDNQPLLEWRLVVAPATERNLGQDYAPLYVAEYTASDDPSILYALIVPVGAVPSQEIILVPMIECDDVLRDGALPGVQEALGSDGRPRACYASNKRAVRQAARRVAIERLGDLASPEAIRFMHIGPITRPAPQPSVVADAGPERRAARVFLPGS